MGKHTVVQCSQSDCVSLYFYTSVMTYLSYLFSNLVPELLQCRLAPSTYKFTPMHKS